MRATICLLVSTVIFVVGRCSKKPPIGSPHNRNASNASSRGGWLSSWLPSISSKPRSNELGVDKRDVFSSEVEDDDLITIDLHCIPSVAHDKEEGIVPVNPNRKKAAMKEPKITGKAAADDQMPGRPFLSLIPDYIKKDGQVLQQGFELQRLQVASDEEQAPIAEKIVEVEEEVISATDHRLELPPAAPAAPEDDDGQQMGAAHADNLAHTDDQSMPKAKEFQHSSSDHPVEPQSSAVHMHEHQVKDQDALSVANGQSVAVSFQHSVIEEPQAPSPENVEHELTDLLPLQAAEIAASEEQPDLIATKDEDLLRNKAREENRNANVADPLQPVSLDEIVLGLEKSLLPHPQLHGHEHGAGDQAKENPVAMNESVSEESQPMTLDELPPSQVYSIQVDQQKQEDQEDQEAEEQLKANENPAPRVEPACFESQVTSCCEDATPPLSPSSKEASAAGQFQASSDKAFQAEQEIEVPGQEIEVPGQEMEVPEQEIEVAEQEIEVAKQEIEVAKSQPPASEEQTLCRSLSLPVGDQEPPQIECSANEQFGDGEIVPLASKSGPIHEESQSSASNEEAILPSDAQPEADSYFQQQPEESPSLPGGQLKSQLLVARVRQLTTKLYQTQQAAMLPPEELTHEELPSKPPIIEDVQVMRVENQAVASDPNPLKAKIADVPKVAPREFTPDVPRSAQPQLLNKEEPIGRLSSGEASLQPPPTQQQLSDKMMPYGKHAVNDRQALDRDAAEEQHILSQPQAGADEVLKDPIEKEKGPIHATQASDDRHVFQSQQDRIKLTIPQGITSSEPVLLTVPPDDLSNPPLDSSRSIRSQFRSQVPLGEFQDVERPLSGSQKVPWTLQQQPQVQVNLALKAMESPAAQAPQLRALSSDEIAISGDDAPLPQASEAPAAIVRQPTRRPPSKRVLLISGAPIPLAKDQLPDFRNAPKPAVSNSDSSSSDEAESFQSALTGEDQPSGKPIAARGKSRPTVFHIKGSNVSRLVPPLASPPTAKVAAKSNFLAQLRQRMSGDSSSSKGKKRAFK